MEFDPPPSTRPIDLKYEQSYTLLPQYNYTYNVTLMPIFPWVQPEGWFEHSWVQEMATALTMVIRSLRKKYGERPETWAWGHIRPLVLKHPVGDQAPLNKVFNLGPFPWGGDANTVSQGGGYLSNTTGNPLVIASLRMVVDVGNWENNLYALPGGQSGNPISPHYDDLLPFWQRGDGVPIAWSSEEVGRVTRSILRLVPD